MKAIVIKGACTPDELRVAEIPNSIPKDNDIVIKQIYASVNYGDVIRRKRGMFALNEYGYFVPGFEGMGKVISVGKNVKRFNVGDRVSYLIEASGGYSEEVTVNENCAFRILDEIEDKIAAVIPCVGTTAWNLVEISQVKRHDWVIIHGATGGVGLLLVQLCMLKGANVIAIVGTIEKRDFLKKYSLAKIVLNNDNLVEEIRNITQGKMADVIFDCVGSDVCNFNFDCIHTGGTIVYYGSTSGHSEFPGMNVLMNSIRIQGFNIFNLLNDSKEWEKGAIEMMDLISQGKIHINVDRVFKLEQAGEAHKLLESRKVYGKLLIDFR